MASGDPGAPHAKKLIIFFQRVARPTTHFFWLYYDGRKSPERNTKILRVGVALETSTCEDLENLDLNSALSLTLRCHQSDCQKLDFVYFEELRTFNTSETLEYRFKMILLDQGMDLKKIPSKNIFSFWGKNILKNKIWKHFFFVSQKISNLEILDFSKTSTFPREKIKISISRKKSDFFQNFFLKIFFDPIFFRWIFFKSISWSAQTQVIDPP